MIDGVFMKKYIFALPNERAEKKRFCESDVELETAFPMLLPIRLTAEQGDTVNVTLIITENSEGTRSNFLTLMMELKKLAQETGFRYELTEIRITGEEAPRKQKRVFEALIETIGDDEEIFADITFGNKALPLVIFTALSYGYKLRRNTEIKTVFYAELEYDEPKLHDISTLFHMESVIHSVSRSVPDEPLSIIKRILNM